MSYCSLCPQNRKKKNWVMGDETSRQQQWALSSPDILRLVFEKLPLPGLARAACVCRCWRPVASDADLIRRSFISPWRLKEVVGDPISGTTFWRDNGIGKFAISHPISRWETIAGLAVKYSVQVVDIKRLNNMMSDHGIYSRDRLLIPVSNPDTLVNRVCYIEMETHAKREVAVLYLEGEPHRKHPTLPNGLTTTISVQGKGRVLDSLKRNMQVDDGTAQYYLAISNGDPRTALSEFCKDVTWERQAGCG